jgi:hypothetical protein
MCYRSEFLNSENNSERWQYNKSVKREALYNTLLEFGITKKLVKVIKMRLYETYSKVCVGKLKQIISSSK